MGRKRKNFTKNSTKKIIYFILAFIITFIITWYNGNNDIKNKIDVGEIPEGYEIKASDLQIYFFNVGQADSILLINNNQTMLIDAGNNEDGKLISEYLKRLGISKINYLIGTHAHEDHIGGLDDIINNFDIENIYLPYTSSKSNITKTYEDILDSINAKNLSITKVNIGDIFSIGEAKCEIVFVDNEEPEDLNDSSICIRTVFNNQSYLFMADLSSNVENQIVWKKTNVLKVAHHGSKDSSSQKFLNEVQPEISIISVEKENEYNHPNNETLNRLEKIKTNIYRTDELGTILLISDGNTNQRKLLKTKLNGD